jgi:hypothetical protein
MIPECWMIAAKGFEEFKEFKGFKEFKEFKEFERLGDRENAIL